MPTKIQQTILFLSLSICMAPALAADLALLSGFQFGGEFEEIDSGDVINFKDGTSYALALDIETAKNMMVGLYINQQSTSIRLSDSSDKIELDMRYFHLSATERWKHSNNWETFVSGAGGITYFAPDGVDNSTRFSLGLGFGGAYFITESLAFRAETRGFMTLMNTSSSVLCGENGCMAKVSSPVFLQGNLSAGLVYRF